jgi:hypothetical protein
VILQLVRVRFFEHPSFVCVMTPNTKYKFGYQIPCNYEKTLKFNEINHSTKWADTTKLEMLQLNDYECFIDAGIYNYKFTSCAMSSMMDITRHASLAMDSSPTSPSRVSSTQESFHFMVYKWLFSLLSLMGWTCGPQI